MPDNSDLGFKPDDSHDDLGFQANEPVEAEVKTEPQSTSKPLSQTTLSDIGDIATGFGKGLLETGEGFGNLMTFGAERRLAGPERRKQFQQLTEPKGDYQSAGKITEQIGEMLVPIPGVNKIKAAEGAGKLAKTVVNAARGAVDVGLRTGAQTGEWKDAATGAAIGGALEGSAPLVAKGLKAASRSQYGKILHPAGQAAKEVTEAKLLTGKADDLVGQGYGNTALTKKGLLEKFEANRTAANQALETEYNSMPHSAKVNLRPVITDMQNFVQKNAILPNGNISDQALFNQAVRWSNKIAQDMGPAFPDAHPSDVRRFKQILDDQLYKKKLKFNPTTASDQVKTMLVNSVREQLHKQHPNLAAVDKSSSFWKTAAEMMNRSDTAEVGKFNMHRVVRAGVHGALGEEAGRQKGGAEGAVIGGLAGLALGRAFESTAWRSVSAVTKDKVADLIVRGDGQGAAKLATRAIGRATVSGRVEVPSFSSPMPATASSGPATEPTSNTPMGSEFVPSTPEISQYSAPEPPEDHEEQ